MKMIAAAALLATGAVATEDMLKIKIQNGVTQEFEEWVKALGKKGEPKSIAGGFRQSNTLVAIQKAENALWTKAKEAGKSEKPPVKNDDELKPLLTSAYEAAHANFEWEKSIEEVTTDDKKGHDARGTKPAFTVELEVASTWAGVKGLSNLVDPATDAEFRKSTLEKISIDWILKYQNVFYEMKKDEEKKDQPYAIQKAAGLLTEYMMRKGELDADEAETSKGKKKAKELTFEEFQKRLEYFGSTYTATGDAELVKLLVRQMDKYALAKATALVSKANHKEREAIKKALQIGSFYRVTYNKSPTPSPKGEPTPKEEPTPTPKGDATPKGEPTPATKPDEKKTNWMMVGIIVAVVALALAALGFSLCFCMSSPEEEGL